MHKLYAVALYVGLLSLCVVLCVLCGAADGKNSVCESKIWAVFCTENDYAAPELKFGDYRKLSELRISRCYNIPSRNTPYIIRLVNAIFVEYCI